MNRLCLLNKNVCPPDGFRYTFPEDGYVSHAWTHDAWLLDAGNHAHANNLPGPSADDMEEQLCKILPAGWCKYDNPNRRYINLSMSYDDIATGLTTFGRWAQEGRPRVDQAEAERRALVCSRCYLNLPVHGCAACHAAVELAIGKVATKYDHFLRACGVCKCLLRAKVHFPISLLDSETASGQELYPEHCWLKHGGPNYVS